MVTSSRPGIVVGLFVAILGTAYAAAHPASGIAVDDRGRVFFADTREGLWRVDAGGAMALVKRGGLHWMTLDRAGAFAEAPDEFNPFRRSTPRGEKPAVIECGGFPCALGKDGNLYYPRENGLTIVRYTPRGQQSVLVSKEQFQRDWTHNMGVSGMACGPDGTLYVMGCDSFTGRRPGLGGPVYNARLAPGPQPHDAPIPRDGDVEIPVGIHGDPPAIHRPHRGRVPGEVYVLEYDEDTPVPHGDWLPRVTKVGKDRKVTTVATVKR